MTQIIVIYESEWGGVGVNETLKPKSRRGECQSHDRLGVLDASFTDKVNGPAKCDPLDLDQLVGLEPLSGFRQSCRHVNEHLLCQKARRDVKLSQLFYFRGGYADLFFQLAFRRNRRVLAVLEPAR